MCRLSLLIPILILQTIFVFNFSWIPVAPYPALFESYNITTGPEDNTATRDYGHYLGNSNVVGELNSIVYPTIPSIPSTDYDAVSAAIVTAGVVNPPLTEFWYKCYSYFHSNAISRGRIVD